MVRFKIIKSNNICNGSMLQNDRHFHITMKGLENTIAVLVKAIFNDLHALKNKINEHNEDFNILDQNIQNFLIATNDNFYKITKAYTNHHLAIKDVDKSIHSRHKGSEKVHRIL